MRSARRFIARTMIAVAVQSAGHALAQSFPVKPLRIVTSAPGGTSDFTSRIIARGLTETLGQQVIVDNRGNFGAEVVARSQPDGYTLLVEGSSIWMAPMLQRSPYDPLKDFAPITIAVKAANVLVVHPSLRVTSVKELVAYAKAHPGELNYATGGIGGASHLPAELFKSLAGVNIVNVNYKGTGPALNAVLAGEAQMMFSNATITLGHLKAGRVRALAVTSLEPSPVLPAVPTLASSGFPGFESIVPLGVFAPAKTPPELVKRLNRETVHVLNRPDVKERHFGIGVETVASTPEELAALMRSDIARWGKVIRDAGIRIE